MRGPEQYVSTRQVDDTAEEPHFLDVILKSVSADGGLYCPTSDPVPFDLGLLHYIALTPISPVFKRCTHKKIPHNNF